MYDNIVHRLSVETFLTNASVGLYSIASAGQLILRIWHCMVVMKLYVWVIGGLFQKFTLNSVRFYCRHAPIFLNQANESMTNYQCCIKYFQKVFQLGLQITKYILTMYFNYFCQLLLPSSPKYKICLMKVIEIRKYIQESLRVNQSVNIRLINKRNVNIFLCLVLALWLWQFNVISGHILTRNWWQFMQL